GDLKDFLLWGGAVPCSSQMLVEYIVNRAKYHSAATIARRLVGIRRAHTSLGLIDPSKNALVKTVLRGLRRTKGMAQRQAAPVMREELLQMLINMHGTIGARDRALILLGFAAALRRSELVELDVRDLELTSEGLLVHLRRSKTDQAGQGRKVAVPYGRTSACPVKAICLWLAEADIATGAVFRGVNKAGDVSTSRLTDQSVSLIVKKYARTVGLPAERYSGHSLRAGLVTSAARAGVSLIKIQEQTGHRSVSMLTRYIRDARIFENNAAGLLL
ncbi:MAG: site-specific integrase, partial [Polaromonas sp.]